MSKAMPMLDWFEMAIKYEVGEELFVPMEEDSYATLRRHFDFAKERYSQVDTIIANQMLCRQQTAADGKKYFVLFKKPPLPVCAFKRQKDGKVIPIVLQSNDRQRTIAQMREDGYSFDQMRELLPDLRMEEL